MENLFKYIKVSDINPSLKIYYSDPETDAEETRILSSDDELVTTEDEQEENEQYEQLRRRFVLSELKGNKFQNENTRLQSKLIEAENIVISLKHQIEDLENENIDLEKEIKKLKKENIEKVEKINLGTNKKIIFSGILGFVGGIIICYVTK